MLETNRIFGLQRNEIKNLKVKDIAFRSDSVVLVHTKEKKVERIMFKFSLMRIKK